MKKIFWTSIVWILLIIAFVFYVKWFNQPLAESVSNFIFKAEVQVDNCAIVTGEVLSEDEISMKLDKLEEHMNTIEDLIEVSNAETTPDQFDTTLVEQNPSEDELFDEFKTWYKENK